MQAGRRRGGTSRREVLRILAVGGAAGIVSWRLGLWDGGRLHPIRRTRTLMGTVVHLTVAADDPAAAAAAADATLGRMADLESRLSAYRADSDVGRLNREGRLDLASDALLDVLRVADRIGRLGDGAFDITVQPLLDLYRDSQQATGSLPAAATIEGVRALVGQRRLLVEGRAVRFERDGMRLTLDGVGKGYIIDRAIDVLRAHGLTDVLVEAGGDLVASGGKAPGTAWQIGIASPRPGLGSMARFDACDRAVATSGDYMQPFANDFSQHHILDPRTGYSSPELASATVLAPDAATADALATLVMVLGSRRGRALLEDLPGCEGYLIGKNLEVTRTSSFHLV